MDVQKTIKDAEAYLQMVDGNCSPEYATEVIRKCVAALKFQLTHVPDCGPGVHHRPNGMIECID